MTGISWLTPSEEHNLQCSDSMFHHFMEKRDGIRLNNKFYANANAPIHDENHVILMNKCIWTWIKPHPLNTIKAGERNMSVMLSNCCLLITTSQIANALGSTSIKYLPDVNVSGRCLVDVFVIWACVAICSCWTF